MKKFIILAMIGIVVYIVPQGYVPAPQEPFYPQYWIYTPWQTGDGSIAADQYRMLERWGRRNEHQWRREMRQEFGR